ncbi:MAG: acyltransferase domain-containing protein [Desulfobacteraceae bacterium]|nr:acyltransferase domain-containing protein [Desulfobacteraceae bacterium]
MRSIKQESTMGTSVILSAVSHSQLLFRCDYLRSELESESGHAVYSRLKTGNEHSPIHPNFARAGFVSETLEDAIESLRLMGDFLTRNPTARIWAHPMGIFYRQTGLEPAGKTVALFAGQGGQYAGMGRSLRNLFPILQQGYDHMDTLLEEIGFAPISKILFPAPPLNKKEKILFDNTLKKTEYTQPAIGVFNTSLYRLLERLGFEADITAGLSCGELPALWAAGALSDEHYFDLVRSRGRAMSRFNRQSVEEEGMLAVTGDVDKITERVETVENVFVEAWSSINQVVLSGLKKPLQNLQYIFQDRGWSAYMLSVSGAFHSPFMENARRIFADHVRATPFNPPRIPVYSNVTGSPYPEYPQAVKEMLIDHIVRPVRFKEQIENIYRAGGTRFIEFGPKNAVAALVGAILGDKPHGAIALNSGNRRRSNVHECIQSCTLLFAGHPPIHCNSVNICQGGVGLKNLPRTLGNELQKVSILFHLNGHREPVEGQMIWRQGRFAGVQLFKKEHELSLLKRLGYDEGKNPKPVFVKDSFRELQEAVVDLIVSGLALKPLERLLDGTVASPAFSLPGTPVSSEITARSQ